MTIIIPQTDSRLFQVMLVAQNAQRRRGEYEQAGVSRRPSQPAGGQDWEKAV
jgi:hypothetical protein